jgi:hypothetical protein
MLPFRFFIFGTRRQLICMRTADLHAGGFIQHTYTVAATEGRKVTLFFSVKLFKTMPGQNTTEVTKKLFMGK